MPRYLIERNFAEQVVPTKDGVEGVKRINDEEELAAQFVGQLYDLFVEHRGLVMTLWAADTLTDEEQADTGIAEVSDALALLGRISGEAMAMIAERSARRSSTNCMLCLSPALRRIGGGAAGKDLTIANAQKVSIDAANAETLLSGADQALYRGGGAADTVQTCDLPSKIRAATGVKEYRGSLASSRRSPRGDCRHHAFLTAAMCRAAFMAWCAAWRWPKPAPPPIW